MQNRTWWWIGGAAGLAFLLWPKKTATKPGDLAVSVIGFKAGAEDALQAAIVGANAMCSGLPPIQGLSRPATTSGGPDSRSMQVVVSAMWTHDVLGAIKEDVRACLEKSLQAVAPGAKVAAERLT